MSGRVNPFSDLKAVPVFEPKRKAETPVAKDTADRVADENNFPSRQPPRVAKEARRKRRVYTTGRNRQFNIKATSETVERFYRMADERNLPLCALLEQALDALENDVERRPDPI